MYMAAMPWARCVSRVLALLHCPLTLDSWCAFGDSLSLSRLAVCGQEPCSGLGLGLVKALLEAFQVSPWLGPWGSPTTAYLGDVMGLGYPVMCPDAWRWFGPEYCQLLKERGIERLHIPSDVSALPGAVQAAASAGLTLVVETRPVAELMEATRRRGEAERAKAAARELRHLACGPPPTSTLLGDWLEQTGESRLDTMVLLHPDASDEEEEDEEPQHAYAALPCSDHLSDEAEYSAVIRPDLPSPPPCSPYEVYL